MGFSERVGDAQLLYWPLLRSCPNGLNEGEFHAPLLAAVEDGTPRRDGGGLRPSEDGKEDIWPAGLAEGNASPGGYDGVPAGDECRACDRSCDAGRDGTGRPLPATRCCWLAPVGAF